MTLKQMAVVGITATAAMLPACSSGLTSSATDACNFHSSWVSEGQPDDRREQVLAVLSEALSADDSSELVRASTEMDAALRKGNDAGFRAFSERFAELCRENGWEPPEG